MENKADVREISRKHVVQYRHVYLSRFLKEHCEDPAPECVLLKGSFLIQVDDDEVREVYNENHIGQLKHEFSLYNKQFHKT